MRHLHQCLSDAVAPVGITVLTPSHGPRAGLHAKCGVLSVRDCPQPRTSHHAPRPRSWVPSSPMTKSREYSTHVYRP